MDLDEERVNMMLSASGWIVIGRMEDGFMGGQ